MKTSLLIALCFAAVTSACSLGTAIAEEVRIDAKTSLAKFKSGEAVIVTVTITNDSNSSVDIPIGSCPTHFAVRDASGTIVGPPSEVCTAQSIVRTVAAGEKVEYTATWHGEGFASAPGVTTYLKPGVYTVEGFFGINATVNPATVEITA